MPALIFLVMLTLAVMGLVVLSRGLRGRPEFSQPHCAKCGYDLRAHRYEDAAGARCPECGADLSKPKAVLYGKYVKRPRLIWGGLGMLALPVLIVLSLLAAAFLKIDLRSENWKSNDKVIADLSTTAGTPWTWQELERRYRDGRLKGPEVAKAIDQLVVWIDQQRQKGQEVGPLHWSGNFLELAMRNGLVSREQELRLFQAYYGPTPRINAARRLREGQPLKFSITYGGHWNLPGMKFVKALREVTGPDGKPMELTSDYASGPLAKDMDLFSREGVWDVDGGIALKLPPGEYEIKFVVDAGVQAEGAPMVGTNDRPGQKRKWVKPRQTWTSTVPWKFVVLTAEQAAVALVTDAKFDPVSAGTVKAPQVLAKRGRDGKGVVIQMNFANNNAPPVPVVADIFFRINGQEQRVGSYARWDNASSLTPMVEMPSLAPEVTQIDIILRPNAKRAEEWPEIEKIWGGEIVMEGVKVERYDVEKEGEK